MIRLLKKTSQSLVLALLAFALASPAYGQSVNLVTNGSFESPSVQGSGLFPTPGWFAIPANGTLPGWTVNGSVDVHAGQSGVPWPASNGAQGLDLSGGPPSSISQALATGTGLYRLRFDMAANTMCSPSSNQSFQMNVTLGGTTQTFTYLQKPGQTSPNMTWDPHAMDVQLSGPSTLTFQALSSINCGPMIDNVQVFKTPDALGRTGWQAQITPFSIVPMNPQLSSPIHGDQRYYNFAPPIPAQNDPNWQPTLNPNSINFHSLSRLAGYACLQAADFSYFQTFVDIPVNVNVTEFKVVFSDTDDGARITIFNSAHPNGDVVPTSYVYLGGTTTTDLTSLVVSGETNRVAVTQVDDCYSGNNLGNATVVLNGLTISTLTVAPDATSVVLNEGGIAQNSGTFSDTNVNNNVTLSASMGTIIKNGGTNAGTWSWSNPAPDGPSSYPVTITATSPGNTESATFSVTVKNVAPTATFINDGPVNAGNPFTLSLINPNDVNADQTPGAPLQYSFDCDDGAGFSPFLTLNQKSCMTNIGNQALRFVRGRVRDKDGGVTEYTGQVAINHAPNCTSATVFLAEDSGTTLVDLAPRCSDPDGGPLTIQIVSSTGLTGVTPGTFSAGIMPLTPAPNYNGPGGSFTFRAVDSLGLGSNTSNLNITVTPVNDLPAVTFSPSTLNLLEGGSLTFGLDPFVSDIETSDPSITWSVSSSNPAIAASLNLSPRQLVINGLAGPQTGTVTLTATDRGDRTGCSPVGLTCAAPLSASVTITVNVNIPSPPLFSIPAVPAPPGSCLCTPLIMNTNPNGPMATGIQHWFVKTDNSGTLEVTGVAASVSAGFEETLNVGVVEATGSPAVGPPVVAYYPAGTPSGTNVSATQSYTVSPNTVYMIRVSTPNTSASQAHYRLKFKGAAEAAIKNPSFASFESHGSARFFFNLAASETLEAGFFTNGTPGGSFPQMTADVYFVDAARNLISDPPPFSVPNPNPLSPAILNTTFSAPFTGPGRVAMVIDERNTNTHYRVGRPNGFSLVDPDIYLTWESGGEGQADIKIVDSTGALSAVPVTLKVYRLPTMAIEEEEMGVVGSIHSDDAEVGQYRIEIIPPPGVTIVGPSYFDIFIDCDKLTEIVFVLATPTSLTVSPATGPYGGTTSLTATLTAHAVGVSGKTVNFTLNGVPVGSAVTDGSGVATLGGVSLAGYNANSYPGYVGAKFAADSDYLGSSAINQLTVVSTLTVGLAGTGAGGVTGGGINCPGVCTANYSTSSSVILLPAAAPGSVFLGWSGACSGTGACTINTATNQSVVATFATASTTGRMTGGGSVFTDAGMRVTHGMTLQCSTNGKSNIEINWGKGNSFKLNALTSVLCYDDAAIGPQQPQAGFDTLVATGTGTFNKQAATIEMTFTDAGEPGVNDQATIVIKQGATVVLTVSGSLDNGNQQAHKN